MHDKTKRARRDAKLLAGLTGSLGVLHFLKPKPFDSLIPRALPGSPRFWTLASGVAELVITGGLLVPQARRAAGRAATVLYLGVFPGNVQMAWNWRHKSWPWQLVSLGRLPLQADLIVRAERVHRDS
ncbi:hypothetical protein GWK18_07160 [Kocuria sp. JC486]|uniref:DoxX family membrane protein n=1 Tax=Kocuria soli TaxID=2485125 RepID=A0A3N3ZQ35_9MICC|nr:MULTISPECIES: hypothetical protein [Kocuria]NHU85371.1 hypothetical protein [Kocuria sp. JC486]ROZ63260.1 hypothetical protein EDL96_06890 [Kocuria soli]